ncbi:NADH-ubiquinone oxidoreductase-F iron-sulfur binding region domain-containing protein [Halostagnicola bangensis]
MDGNTNGPSPVVRVAGTTDSSSIRTAASDATGDVPVVDVGSTGSTAIEPLLLATLEGETAFVPRCEPSDARTVTGALADGKLPRNDVKWVVEHDPETPILPVGGDSLLATGKRRVLEACGWVDPTSEDDYLARGTVLSSMPSETAGSTDESLLELVVDAGLRGRGRGDDASDEPVGDRWQTAIAADGEPVVVVNANEADHRVTVDSLLLRSDPFSVLDPAVAVAKQVGAPNVVVYVNESDDGVQRTTTVAAESVAAFDGHDVSVEVVVGPDEYKAGEPTMALESLEGNDRLEARRRPPGPAEYGLHGRPTIIHTPRTFAQIRQLASDESVVGVDADPGTRLFDVSGAVEARGIVELPTSATLETVLEAVETEKRMKVACVGGTFGGLTESLDVPANASGLESAGVGTNGAVELFGDDRCAVALAGRRAAFAREQNCGRCVPCREGSVQLTELLRAAYDDQDIVADARELARVMGRSSVCGFGRDAARPVTTALNRFESEFAAHTDGRCPAGECEVSEA